MPVYGDDELLAAAPNIQVYVGTPPTPSPGTFPETTPENVFTILDINSRKTEPIGKDTTNDLIALTKPNSPQHFLIKNYGSTSGVTAPSPPPPPSVSTALSSPVPNPLAKNPPPSSKTKFPDLPPTLLFDEIQYKPKDLIGVVPIPSGTGVLGGVLGDIANTYDPFMKSTYNTFKDFPSAIYVDAIHSCISTPYFSAEAKRHRNGVMNDRRTTNIANTTYFWEMSDKDEQDRILTPRPDGTINVVPQTRSAKTPREFIYMNPAMFEKDAGIENGESLNAFSLVFGIEPGGYENFVQVGTYSIKIIFGDGDVELAIFEGQDEARVSIQGKEVPQKITIKTSVGSVLTTGFGGKVYIVTFIPVWNGMLISFGIPGSSDWGDGIRFISIDPNLDINKAVSDIINPPPKTDEDVPDPNYIPKTVVKRNNKRYMQYGVRVVNSKASSSSLSKSNTGPGIPTTFKMGTRLNIEYYRCGGALKFVPVYFAQYSRYHFIYPGSVSGQDLATPAEYEVVPNDPKFVGPPAPKKLKQKKINQNVFLVPTKSPAVTMPIFGYQSGSFVDFRTHLTTIVKDKQAPYACFSMEFKALTPDVRVPMQVWGGVIVDKLIVGGDFVEVPPPNADGVLSDYAISVPRIKSISVQRSLDGSSGDIEWDRFNPSTQQVDPRPYQEVGGIQIQVTGGKNTVPGIIFTGIAYGNAEVDTLGENLIRIPLKGRESKISSEGGLALVNVPFFDGYDHRDAMLYMSIYGGFPLDTEGELYRLGLASEPLATAFRLISSYNINNPVIDFPRGTPISQAMDQICQYAGALYYFDRFGTCIYIDVQKSTGVNWNIPDEALESFSDETDHTWVRNQILIIALVAYPQPGKPLATDSDNTPTQAVIVTVNLDTYPTFAWSKMAVFTIPQIVRDYNELQRQAVQISKGQSRPRSAARCKIPGNAQIELLDTINGKWLVNSISHQVDLQRKTWSTDIGLELFIPDVEPLTSVDLTPLTDV